MDLLVRERELGGWLVVALDGEVDFHTAERMSDALSEAHASCPWLIVDCERLTFADSSFLGVLMRAYRRSEADGGSLVVAAAPQRLQCRLGVTGLDQVLSIYPSATEAAGQHRNDD